MVKALDGLVKKDDIVETEGFSTVMVVVPRYAGLRCRSQSCMMASDVIKWWVGDAC